MKKFILILSIITIFILVGCGASDSGVILPEETDGESDAEYSQIEKERSVHNTVDGAVIVIDAGHQMHGNSDQEPIAPGSSETKAKVSGGTGGVSTGKPEYVLTLEIAEALKAEMENKGCKVIMTRESSDVDISNSERAAIANDADADVFIRLHANGSDDENMTGAMTICQTGSNTYNGNIYKECHLLSECVLDEYTSITGINREKVWETDTMSGINWSEVPVTILEMGYMTNAAEDEKMSSPEFQKKMVKGISVGIEKYLKEKQTK